MYGFLLNTLDPSVIDPSFENRLSMGAGVLLRGMLTVFAVLSIIWLFVVLLRVFIHDLPKRSVAKKAAKAKVEEPVAVTAESFPVAPPADAELIAVITAAIAAYTADEGGMSFRVVSFRRVNQ